MVNAPEKDVEDIPEVSALLLRLVIALIVLGLLTWQTALWLQEPIEKVSFAFVEAFGPFGMFAIITVLDAIPGTFHEPVLILAYDGGMAYTTIVVVAGTASVLAGVIGWTCGRLLGKWSFMERLLLRYRVTPFMRRYGGWAVALAAITPFPYAITTWGAGAADVPLSTLLVGALFRYIKVALYLGIIIYGWTLGA